MTKPADTASAPGNRYRKPRVGERTRGAVDALQTKIAIDLQNLDPDNYIDQLQANIDELPEAAGTDSAFIALFTDDGSKIRDRACIVQRICALQSGRACR